MTDVKRGRKLTELALRARNAVEAALGTEPMTRSKILAALTDEGERKYVNTNWQNIIGKLLTEQKARLADGSNKRGRGVRYQKVI